MSQTQEPKITKAKKAKQETTEVVNIATSPVTPPQEDLTINDIGEILVNIAASLQRIASNVEISTAVAACNHTPKTKPGIKECAYCSVKVRRES